MTSTLGIIALMAVVVFVGLLHFAAGAEQDVRERSNSIMGESPLDKSTRRFWHVCWVVLSVLLLIFALSDETGDGGVFDGVKLLWREIANTIEIKWGFDLPR
jgi:Na+/H+ antiporter NhaD/arsenite permease-like protein